jgi:hypothetical protein|nr:MAG TPA: hypothetical protein [Crassvirales sp.]
MDTSEVFKSGEINIPNPNYNPKKKKNKEAPYIFTNNVGRYTNPQAEAVASSAGDNWVMDENYSRKYQRYGITPNRISPNLDKELADAQSNWTKGFNAISQAVVSETLLGTLKAFPDLFDAITNGFLKSDGDYQNPISNKLQEWQDYFDNEVAPIYSDPTRADILHGGLTNFGWWASNLPSVMSSLTLLIPSTGIIKSIGYLGKLAKIGARTRKGLRALSGVNKAIDEGKALNGFQKAIIAGTGGAVQTNVGRFASLSANALLQRTMENYQEAQSVYKDMYSDAYDKLNNMTEQEYAEFINKNKKLVEEAGGDSSNKDAIARRIAKRSADEDFKFNYWNVGFDILQMYGLRNMWKGIKSGENSGTLNKVLREQKAKVGKTAEEFEKYQQNLSKWTKVRNNLVDRLKGEKVVVAWELSEGIEEAINTIAQEEGMHVGKELIGEDVHSSFDNRLQKYLQSGAIYDSAFWGVMGGVVFHHLGSGFGRLQQTLEDRANSKVDEKTGESKKKSPFSISELGEIKSRREDMNSWSTITNRYIQRAQEIKEGKNPYSIGEDDKTLKGESDTQAAKQKADNDFITDMTLNAAHKGNLDYLRAFMASDEVRKAMVEKGVVTEAESKEHQQRMLSKIDSTIDSYTNNLAKLINLVDNNALNKAHKNDIVPIEYLQGIASNNVKYQQVIQSLNLKEQQYDQLIADAFANEDIQKVLGNKYTPEQFRAAASHALIANTMAALYAEKRKLMKNKLTLSDKVAIDNIDRTLKEYGEMLDDNEYRLAVAHMINSDFDKEGKLIKNPTNIGEEFDNIFTGKDSTGANDQTDAQIIANFKAFAKKYNFNERLGNFESEENVLDQLNKHNINTTEINNLIVKADKVGLPSDTFSKLLVSRSDIELNRRYNQAQLITNADTLSQELSFLQNTMNETRKKVIDKSYKLINELADKYKDEENNSIKQAVDAYYVDNDNDFDSATSFMTAAEKSSFKEALDALHLNSGLNYRLGKQIQGLLGIRDKIKDARNKAKDSEEKNAPVEESKTSTESTNTNITGQATTTQSQSSTQNASNSSSQSVQSQQTNNQSGTQQKSPTSKVNREKSNVTQTKSEFTPKKLISFTFDKDGNPTKANNVDDGYELVAGEDGTYEVTGAKCTDDRFYNNAYLATNNEAQIVYNPYVKFDDEGNVISFEKGKLGTQADVDAYEKALDEAEKQKEEQAQDEEQSSSSSTGELSTEPESQTSNDQTTQVEEETKPEEKPEEKPESKKEEKKGPSLEEQDEFKNTMSRKILNDVRSNPDLDLSIAKQEYINEAIKFGFSEEEAKNMTDVWFKLPEKVQQMLRAKNNKYASIPDLIVMTADKALDRFNQLTQQYNKVANDFLKEYASNVNLPVRNGKYYGRLEDILRYVEDVTKGAESSDFIFDAIKNYLKTNEAKELFVLTDENQVDRAGYLKDSHKTTYQRNVERITGNYLNQVNINNLSEILDEDGIAAAEKELSLIQPGDELEVEKGNKLNKSTQVILYKHNGVTIGWQALSSINRNTGRNTRIADCWVHELDLTREENDGMAKNFFKQILSREGNFATLDDIVYKAAFDKLTKDKLKQLVTNFATHPRIQEAIKAGILKIDQEQGFTYEKALNGIAKIWRYNYELKDDTDIFHEDLGPSIDNYYNKLRTEISAANMIADGDFNITVGIMSKGEVIRAKDKELKEDGTTRNTSEVAAPISTALSAGTEAYIGVGVNGYVSISGLGNQNFGTTGSARSNQTYLCLPNTNGTIDYVAAYPITLRPMTYIHNGKETEIPRNQVLDTLVNSVIGQIQERLLNIKDFNDWNDLRDLIANIYSFDKNGILGGIRVYYDNYGNVQLFCDNGNKYTLFAKNVKGNVPNIIKVEINGEKRNISFGEAANLLEEDIRENTRVNINSTLVAADNNRAMPIKNKFIHYDKEGFHINIPAYNGNNSFNINTSSYNSFLISNNLLRVDLAQENSSNYRRIATRKQGGNQTLNIDIHDKLEQENPPVEDIEEVVSPDILQSDITNIINDKDIASKGSAIAERLMSDQAVQNYETLKNKVKGHKYSTVLDGLFPENIIFDDEAIQTERTKEDGDANVVAYYNPKTNTIVVGKDWLNIASNPNLGGGNRAARVLIHENLHKRINASRNKVKAKRQLKTIYDDFAQAIDADILDLAAGKFDEVNSRHGNIFKDENHAKEFINHIAEYKFDKLLDKNKEDTAIEEFIVESLTSEGLIQYLNSVHVEGEHLNKGTKSIWQRIMEFINNIFGFDIADESLRAKEFNTLAKAFSNEKKTKIQEGTLNFKEDETQQTKIDNVVPQQESETESVSKEELQSEEDEDKSEDNELVDDNTDLNVNEEDIDEDDDIDYSSVPDKSLNSYSTVFDSIASIPLSEQAKFASLIEQGEVSVTCQ